MKTGKKNTEKKNWGWTLRRSVAMLLVLIECFSLMAVGFPASYADSGSVPLSTDTQLDGARPDGELSDQEEDKTGETSEEPEYVTAVEAAETAEAAAEEAEAAAQEAEEALLTAEEAEALEDAAAAAEQARAAAERADLALERAQLAADFAAQEADRTAWAAEDASLEAEQAAAALERMYGEEAETIEASADPDQERKAESSERPERKTEDTIDGWNRNEPEENDWLLTALEEAIAEAARTKDAEEYALAAASEAAEAYERAVIAADAATAAAKRAKAAADSATEIEAAKAAEAEQNTDGDETDGDETDGDESKGDEIDGDETKGDETKGDEKTTDDSSTEKKEEAPAETLIYSDSAVSLSGEAPAELVVETEDVSAHYADFDPNAFLTRSLLKTTLFMNRRAPSRRSVETKYSVLAAYDISLSVEGEKYQPDADSPLTVSISDPAINKDLTLQVWHILDDGTGEQIYDFTVEGDSVTFAADSFSAYLVVQVTVTTYITAGDGNTYLVSVTYDQDAEMPENADLAVRELDDDEKKDYVNQSAQTLKKDAEDFLFARAFDISLIDPETGDKLQPVGDVKVSISLLDTDVSKADKLNLLHFGKEVETVDYTLNESAVEFDTDGFSVFVLCGYTVDFHWGEYTYSIAGESEIKLSALLEKLGVTEITVADVADVAFSDPTLVEVKKIEATEEQTEDWLLRSLAPFHTDEKLTLTLKNGRSVEIKVTDAQANSGTWENGSNGNGSWSIDENGVLTITGTGAMIEYGGVTNTPWYDYINKNSGSSLFATKLVFSNGVTTVGKNSFTRPFYVEEINAQNCTTLTTIGESAFKQSSFTGGSPNNKSNPKRIDFSGCTSLNKINSNAFQLCEGIQYLDISGTQLTQDHLSSKTAGFGAKVSVMQTLKANNCAKLTGSLDLSSYTALTTLELSGCTGLTALNVSGCTGLTKLDASGCTALTTLDVSGLTGLTDLTVPSGVTMLDISGCTGLDSLDLSSCTALTTVKVGNRNDLTNLTWLTLPDSVTTLDASGFTSLTSVDVPATVTSLNVSGCTGLTALDLSATSLTTINVSNNASLTALELPASVTSLDVTGCPNLVIYFDGKAGSLPVGLIPDGAKLVSWGDYSYSIERNSTVTLDNIFNACGISAITSADVESITGSDDTILQITPAAESEPAKVTNLKTFTGTLTLTLTLENGMSGTISMALAPLQESSNLNGFLDENTVYSYEGKTEPHPLSESAILGEDNKLNLTLSFSEIPEGEEDERQMALLAPMTYTFPAGLTVNETTLPTSVTISVENDTDYPAAVELSTDGGAQRLVITGDFGAQQTIVGTASFTVPVTVQPTQVPGEYALSDNMTLSVVKPRNVKVTSFTAGDYNEANGTITYTAVVAAESNLDTDEKEYPVVIADGTFGDSPALQFVSGGYTYEQGNKPAEKPATKIDGADVTLGTPTKFTQLPLTIAHMYDGDTITLTYTAKVLSASYRGSGQAEVQNTVTITNNDGNGVPNPSNKTEDDTATADTFFDYSPLTREFDRLEGSWAYWKVTVNPMGYTLNGGRAMTLADTFDDDYPDKDHKTDANQSIDYNSVEIKVNKQPDTAGAVSYDYSGNTGTFVIPDNTAVTVTYRTRITANAGEKKHFRGTAVLKTGKDDEATEIARSTAGVTEETPGYEEGMTIYPSASDVAGSGTNYMVKLFVYAEGQMQTGVSGVQFILLDANQRSLEYEQGQPVTFTTGSDGYVNISLDGSRGITIEKNTAYYLEMIQAPAGYQKDNQLYSFIITDDPGYNSGGIYTYYNGDTMKVRLYPVTPGLRVSFRFSGSYTLRDDQKNSVDAVLQHEVNNAWVELERHSVSEAKWGAITFNTELSQVDKYRVIEENEIWDLPELIRVETTYYCLVNNEGFDPSDNPIPFSPPVGSENVSVDVVIDNRYEEPQLTLVKMNKKTGELLSGAVFSVYKIVNGSVADPVRPYTTDKNGELVIRGGDDFKSETLYGVVETTQPAGYLLPQTGREEWHYFYFCNDAVLEPSIKANLPEGETAVNLTSSGDRITIDNQKKNITIPVMVLWQGNTWPENTTVKVGLYQSFDGGVTRTPVTDDQSGQPLTVVLSKAAPYNESDFTDLPSRDDQDHNITYSIKEEEINGISPLEARYVQEYGVSDAGVYVVRNRKATSLTVTKEWYDQDGTQITSKTELAKQPTVTFDVYRTTDFVLPETGSDVITSANMSDHVSNAEKVREGLTIDHSRNWNEAKSDWEYTINDLELMNDDRTPYLYYVLETVPSFGDETYKIKNRELEQNVYNIEAVTIRNTIKTETAQLTVTKAALVNDPRPESLERAFEFTLKLQTNDSHPIRYWTVNPDSDLETDWDGEVKFYLKPTKSIALTLPVGTTATITETIDPEYTVQTSTGGETLNSRTYSYDVTSGSSATLTYINTLRAVCMVQPENSTDPVVFESLKSALTYLSENPESFASTWTIYMLEDYDIPAADVLDVQAGQDVILTTASTDNTQTFYFKTNRTENTDRAVITRGGAGGSILKNAGTLTLENIVLDGAKDNYTVTENGGLVNSTGTLNLNDKAVLRNSATDGEGGAIWSSGIVNIVTGVQITGNSAASASAICLADGTLNISGGVIENNISAEDGAVVAETAGVRIYPTGSPKIYGNTNADSKAANIYLNANSDLIITVKDTGLSQGAQIGVTALPGHMEIGEQFATADYNLSDEAKARMNCFVNDTNGYLGKMGEGSQTSIVWDGLTMEIKKFVDSVGANPSDRFDITITSSMIRKGSYIISGNYEYSVVPGRTGVSGKIILHGVKADDIISISPLPAGTYIVAEASSNYKPTFAGVTADTTTQIENGVQFSMAENSTVTVTNTRRLAAVKLTKTLEDRLVGDASVDFFFTIKLTDGDTPISGFALGTGIITNANGEANFTMSPKDAVDVIQNLEAPVGAAMTITEDVNSNYRITTSAETIPAEGTGTAIEDQNAANNIVAFTVTDDGAAVTFENERKMAHIDLTKELVGKVSAEESYTFSVTLLRTDGSPVADYDMSENTNGSIKTNAEGKVSITIKFLKSQADSADVAQTVHTASVTLVIPEGTKLTVAETDANGHAAYYKTTVSRNGESASEVSILTINSVSDDDNSIVFRNERELHTVTVTNNVSGYAGNVTPFQYIATVTDWAGEGEKTEGYDDYDDHGFTNGVLTFELASGQTKALRVPYGAKLTVEEIFMVGYETKVNGTVMSPASDEADVTEDKTIAFTNTQLINLVLENKTPVNLTGINVAVSHSNTIYRVTYDTDGKPNGQIKVSNNKKVDLAIDANETAILELNYNASQTYTVSGNTPVSGYYYTIKNEPAYHEDARPALMRVFNVDSFSVAGNLKFGPVDSTITFTTQPLVSFDVNGGAWTTEMEGYHPIGSDRQVYQKAVDSGSKAQAPSPAPVYPTAEGIVFLGWTADETVANGNHADDTVDFSGRFNFEADENKVTAPLTLYAVWKKNPGAGRVVTVKNAAGAGLTVSVTLTDNNGAIADHTLATGIVTNSNGEASFTLSVGSSVNLAVPNGAKLVLTTAPSAYGRSEQFANAATDGSFTINSVTRDGTVTFTSGVCKITDEDGILYVKSTVNGNTVYTPAVFGTLSEAFTAYDGELYNSTGTEKTPAYVKMLVDEYEIVEKHTFPTKSMTLTTAGSGDESFPYTGTRDRATLYRDSSFTNDTLFVFGGTNTEVTLDRIILDGRNISVSVGGGLIWEEKTGAVLVTTKNTIMRNVTCTNGAIHVKTGTLKIEGGLFSNLKAVDGGAIYVEGSSTLNLSGSDRSTVFEDCTASSGDGGAIYYKATQNLGITGFQTDSDGNRLSNNPGIVFNRCVAASSNGDGGAIYVTTSYNYTVSVSDCEFTECSSKVTSGGDTTGNGGGGISAYQVKGLNVARCSFTDCDTMRGGGAVTSYVSTYVPTTDQPFTVTDGSITKRVAIAIEDCSFERCNCRGQGGAVAVYQKETGNKNSSTLLFVKGSEFNNCSSGTQNGSGGAIQCYLPCFEFVNSQFNNCWAGKEGGAVNNYFGGNYNELWTNSSMTVSGCTFTKCRAEDRFEVNSVIHYGGAINTKVKTVNVINSTFTDCVSTLRDGGALHLGGCGSETSATITGSTFTRCTAKRHGGAVFSSTETLTISGNTTFTNCASTADLGGAVYHGMNCREESNVKASTSITSCTFDSCSAAVNGGAIWSAARAASITGCTITGCTAESGGAIYLSKKDIKNTINGSRVETGLTPIEVTKPTDALARGTITGGSITKCQAVNGSAVYVGDSAVFSGVTVGGQETNTSKPGNICTNSDSGAIHADATNAAKLYFEGNTVVENNKYSEDLSARDVLMQVNGETTINTTANGLGLSANIGVYVPDKDQDGVDGQFTGHGQEDTPFGTWWKVDDLLGSFFNDRDKNLFGYQSSATDTNIYWGPYVCKITDAEGNTLKRSNGGDAVYTRLSYALDEFTSVKDENGQTNAVYIKMLVEDYAIRQEEAISNFSAANITLTTETHTGENAVTGEYDGKHPYRGTTGSVCTIYRTNSNNPLFSVGTENAVFQLKDITLDGRKSKTATEGDYKLITASTGEIIVNSGTTLQYARGDSGAAITGVTVTINGSYDETKKAPTVKITNCTATTNGGAISAQNLTITNDSTTPGKYGTAFTNCTAATSGGAIYATGTAVTMAGASFTDCHSTGEGGALFHNYTGAEPAATTITNCAFSGSGAGGAGGAVSSTAATLTVSGSGFNTCTAATNGGAINHTGTASSTITGSTFSACSATGFGGSVYTGAAAVTLTGGSFQNSTAANHGGAVYLQNSANETTISGTNFDNCTTTYSDGCGGAVYANGKTLTLQDYTPEGGTTKTGTVITNCKAPKYSGAVHMETDSSTLNITGSTSISRCYAKEGAAIYLKPTVIMNLSDSASFTKNGFSTSGQQVMEGACIYLSEGSLLNISGKLTFSENHPRSDRYVTNGGVYSLARQDIYIGGYADNNATSLHIAGELTGDTIWVWMQHEKHQQPVPGKNQFATTETGVSAASLEKLRNAHDKDVTLCLNSDYLTGVRLPRTDTTGTLVYWNRVYEVSFKKKDNKNYPVVGAEFILYTDAACTTEVARARSADGENDKDAKGGVLEEGTVYFEAIPIGIYYMKEEPHKSYKPNTATYLVLVGTPTLVSDEYNSLWESGPLNVTNAKTNVSENTNGINYGVYELDTNSIKAILDTNLASSGKYIVNERLDYSASFMKLDGEDNPLAGASFTIYVAKDTVETTDKEGKTVLRPALNENGFPSLKLWENNGESEITSTSADGTNKYRDMDNQRLDKGVVYFREIPIGTYYLRETAYPERNGNNRISFYVESDRVFRLEVLGEEGIKLYEWDSSNATAYTDSLMDMYDSSYYSVSNINAVCKLTNGSTLLYERSLDGETLHPAVYATLEDGFDAAQKKNFYDAEGKAVTVLNDLKLQVLKDFTFSESITYSNADRPLTFTTASRTASDTDRYIFNTSRTSDTSRALISRNYNESNVQDGALITLENVASMTLQNIRLDGDGKNGRAIRVKKSDENTSEGNFNLTIGTQVQFQNFKVESDEFSELKGGAILVDDGTSLTINGGFNRTAIFNNNTVVNNKSNDSAEGGAIALETGDDVLISYARFDGNTASASNGGESFGGAVSVGSSTRLTIDKVGFFTNTAANGGAVSVAESGELTIKTGELSQNTATANGGAVYLTGGATAVFNSGSFLENTAADNGGAVWVGSSGTLSMSGVTISDNKAATGSAVYADNSTDSENPTNVTVIDSSITGNKATDADGGAINVGGGDARVYFGGTVTVFDNKLDSDTNKQRNVVLSLDTNAVINTTENGLSDGVIGVYVLGENQSNSDVFPNHGLPGLPFGTFGDSSRLNPQVFRSDHALSLYGVTVEEVKDNKGENLIYWVDVICKLTDENDKILYQDINLTINGKKETRKAQAVYARITDYEGPNDISNGFNALINGFDAAQDKLFVRDENYAFSTYENTTVKLKMLKDYELDKSIRYRDSRMVTFTTAELQANLTPTKKQEMNGWGDYFWFNTDRTDADGKALITRAFANDSMIVDEGTRLTLTDITLDGAKNSYSANVNGGIVRVESEAALTITDGATLQNSATTENGGAVYVSTRASATFSGGTINGNTAANGGAVYAAAGSTLNVSGGTINGNTAYTGAGIYLAYTGANNHATLYLSGNPYFGGTGRDGNDNIIVEDANRNPIGNLNQNTTLGTNPTNGGKAYTTARQDIYLTGTDETLRSIVLTGALTDPNDSSKPMQPGSIWIWAEGETGKDGEINHYKVLKQFAVYGNDVKGTLTNAALEASLKAFRNARTDEATENATSSYLDGTGEGEDAGCIYWSGVKGSRRVILRKVVGPTDGKYSSMQNVSFNVYAHGENDMTKFYVVKHEFKVDNKIISATEPLSGLKPDTTGVFWVGELPFGKYDIEEVGVGWFLLIVGDDDGNGHDFPDGYWISPRGDAKPQ